MKSEYFEEFKQNVSHACYYTRELVWQIFASLWSTLVFQNIVSSVLQAAIGIGIAISSGVLKIETRADTVYSIELLLFWMIAVVGVWSFLKAPVLIDRRRLLQIATLEKELSHHAESDRTSQTKPGNVIAQQDASRLSAVPVLEIRETRFAEVGRGAGDIYSVNGRGHDNGFAYLATFRYVPSKNGADSVSVRAHIEFFRDKKEAIPIGVCNDGVWLESRDERQRFRQGDAKTLIVAQYRDDNLTMLEYNSVKVRPTVHVLNALRKGLAHQPSWIVVHFLIKDFAGNTLVADRSFYFDVIPGEPPRLQSRGYHDREND